MRTRTASETNILGLHNRSNHLKVSIYANSQWYDMTNLEGYNWVINYSQSRTIDNCVSEATVTLWKKVYGLNLSTLVDGSKLNANGVIVDIAHQIKVETATTGHMSQPLSADWKEVFSGYIEEIDWGLDKIQLKCLDLGSNLNQTFIETQNIYPKLTPPRPVQEVMQDILDDHAGGLDLFSPNGTAGTPFNAGDDPGWDIGYYKQGKQPVLQAIQKLAQQIGYDVRYKWQNNTSAFKLVMDVPDRDIAARGTISVTGNISVSDTFVVNATTFTCVASSPGANQFINVSGDIVTTCNDIVRMLRASNCSEINNIEAWRSGNSVVIEWKVAGTVGNSKTFTESLTNATVDGGGVLGGTRAGVNTSTTPDWTFTDNDYQSIDRCSLSRANIRNVVRVTYGFINDDDLEERVTVVREDTSSITKYGRRYMEITEASGSEINTTAEASDFAQACLQDLREPIASLSVQLPYFWAMELNDLIRISANGDHFDSNQDLAVVSINDNFSDNMAITTLELRGKPTGGINRWLEAEGRPGVAPGQDLYQDTAPSPSINVGISTIIVTFDDPRITNTGMKDWAYTDCYVSTVNDFTPDSSTLVASGRQTRFEVNGLSPGETYYVKLVSYDMAGNPTSPSSQVYETTQKVAPYHENGDREHGVLLLNGDFGAQTLAVGDNEPDFWSVIAGTWGASDDVYIDTTTAKTGGRSLLFRPVTTSPVTVESDLIPVKSDRIYALNWSWYLLNSFGNGNEAGGNYVYIGRYDKDKSFISNTSVGSFVRKWWSATDYADSTWHTMTFPGIAFASNVRYIKIGILKAYHSATFTAYFDRLSFREIPPSFKSRLTNSTQSISASTWTTLDLSASTPYATDGTTFDHGNDFDDTNNYFVSPRNGIYQFSIRSKISASCNMQFELRKDTGGGFATLETSPWFTAISGSVYGSFLSEPTMLNSGDKIEARIYHNHASSQNIAQANTNFSGRKVDKE